MAKDWFDIIDTTVKIGLGALISGGFTYLGLRLTKRSELKKYSLEHKIKLIEEVSLNLHTYFSAWVAFISSVNGISKSIGNDSLIDFDYSAYNNVDSDDIKLIEAWPLRDKAASTLILMNDIHTYNLVCKCADLQNELRHLVTFDGKLPSSLFLKGYTSRVLNFQKEVEKSLARFYQASFNE